MAREVKDSPLVKVIGVRVRLSDFEVYKKLKIDIANVCREALRDASRRLLRREGEVK